MFKDNKIGFIYFQHALSPCNSQDYFKYGKVTEPVVKKYMQFLENIIVFIFNNELYTNYSETFIKNNAN